MREDDSSLESEEKEGVSGGRTVAFPARKVKR